MPGSKKSQDRMATNPRRGEVWLVNLDPTRGSEIQKTRPVVVVSSDAMNVLPVRLVAPITTYQLKHSKRIWAVPIDPAAGTGLDVKSTVMPEQTRCVATERFIRLLGVLPVHAIEEVDAALKIVMDLP
ncbi:MAG: Endoribonuclease MazF9 [Fimbriimonadales bacterium]|nr:Endoribonuclease MazF9 [Fimbriimonadales bacterium]